MKRVSVICGFLMSMCLSAQKIEVLNFATFHMGKTPDATKVSFDPKNEKSQKEVFEIAKLLAEFKPTIICVELLPAENEKIKNDYQNFLKNKKFKTAYEGEVSLLAYQIAKIANVKKIYGIDEQETGKYNYRLGYQLKNQVDSTTYKSFISTFIEKLKNGDNLSVKEKLIDYNKESTLQDLITANADILTHVSTANNFEGADEAAKYYRRNLRMYSNLNQIPLVENDKVLIISGATHAAFFSEFLKRSPKYQIVNVFDYLK
ncbi:hypothetical protein BBI01_20255 [Chryseobacterium artocarpi]|uniref:TraB/GumN family protein n=1 Tax=Chryseobacterium artocarpi TaxID=1414727 RepID=A0A1B8Z961_9FLAO|nr:DUF5694 domain-containing protein [Chryseobacterium artocarpi]OCA68159.1 hypothetical protein BBI01_20255 [Chryseobacterium artocarpi]